MRALTDSMALVEQTTVGISASKARSGTNSLQPELGAFANLTGPQADDVPGALDRDGQGEVDGPVGDRPVANLHVHRVEEGNRIDRVQGRVLPLGQCPRRPCR